MTKQQQAFESQFSLESDYYHHRIDLSDWFRYYEIIRKFLTTSHASVLEIGIGNNVIKQFLKSTVKNYTTIDINSNLCPDVVCDIRLFQGTLENKFDAVICSEVLEHMPFHDFSKNLENMYRYLAPGGRAYITLPHHRGRIMLVTPLSYHVPIIVDLPRWVKGSMRSFIEQVIKRKTWVDPHHCWEIDDRNIKIRDIAGVMEKAGFTIIAFERILQADFWVLSR